MNAAEVSRKIREIARTDALYGLEQVKVNDRAVVVTNTNLPATLSSNGTVVIGVEAKTGTVYSQSSVSVADRATIRGDVFAPAIELVHLGNGVTLTGTIQGKAWSVSPNISLSVPFANFPGCGYQTVERGSYLVVPNCLYEGITVRAGAHLQFGTGKFYTKSLIMDSGSMVDTVAPGMPAELYVKENLIYRGTSSIWAGDFFAYYDGEASVPIGGLFQGTFVAPRAEVVIDSANTAQRGAFLGRRIELHQGQWVKHVPYGHVFP